MRYHTTDIGERAAAIAHREADKVWRETNGNYAMYLQTWYDTYYAVLREFNST